MGYNITISLKSGADPAQIQAMVQQIVTRATGMTPNVIMNVSNAGGQLGATQQRGATMSGIQNKTENRIYN